MNRPPIPDGIKRELRQEACFGCVICGSPIIEYHHIDPYHIVRKHEKENLVVLCPEHHHRANCGELIQEKVIQAKKNPFNKSMDYISKDFFLKKYSDVKVRVGGNTFQRVPVIIEVDGTPLISMVSDIDGYAVINIKFYNPNNVLLAEIKDNEWIAYRSPELWDIKYSPGHLVINRKSKKILLEFKINEDYFDLRAEMFYNNKKILATPKEMFLENIQISSCSIVDCAIGISINQ